MQRVSLLLFIVRFFNRLALVDAARKNALQKQNAIPVVNYNLNRLKSVKLATTLVSISKFATLNMFLAKVRKKFMKHTQFTKVASMNKVEQSAAAAEVISRTNGNAFTQDVKIDVEVPCSYGR